MYSQMELRGQAHYTIKLFGGDLNLCRAYMPFKCYKIENNNKIKFDYKDIDMVENYDKYTWYREEDGTEWTPTDLHTQTTINAFGKDIVNDPNFKHFRKCGKVTNFASNYGAGYGALRANSALKDLSDEQIKKLHDAYGKTFPMVQKYQNVVQRAIQTKGYVVNEFGRRYYIKNSKYAYKCGNYLIQGTCADAVKEVQIKIYKLIKNKHLRTRVIISVHDELIVEVADGEDFIIKDIINIMQDQPWALCPFKVEPEMFTDNWANKREVQI